MMTSSERLDPRSRQLRTWYDQRPALIAALDADIGRALSELDCQIQRERLADLRADRKIVASQMQDIETRLDAPWIKLPWSDSHV